MANFLNGILFLGISALVCLGALEMSVGSLRSPGPGLYPLLLGFTLGFLSLMLFVVGLNEAKTKKHQLRGLVSPHFRQVSLVVGVLFSYTGLLPLVGYSIASFFVLGALFTIGAPGKSWLAITLSAAILTVSTEVLAFVLEIPLPRAYVGELLPIVLGG